MDAKRKLKFTEKLAYGLADFPEAANSILAAFLTMFYTDNIGMAAGAVGTMFFISKLFDGISDILAGTLIDRTRTRWGKARPWLLWLAVPTGLALALIFFIPQDGSETTKLVYAFLTYNLYTAGLFAGFFLSKEYVTSVESVTKQESRISFGEGLKLFFTNKYLILALVMTVLVNFVTQVNSSSQTYFYTYTMGDPMLTTSLNLVSIIPILAGIVLLVGPCLAKFGKRNCMYIGIIGQFIGSVVRGFAGMTQSVPLLVIYRSSGSAGKYFIRRWY